MDSAQLSQQQEGTTYSLVLRNVAQHDAGVYTCLAQNAGGQVLCKAELLVHGGKSGNPSQVPVPASCGCGVPWPPIGSVTGNCPHRYYRVGGQWDGVEIFVYTDI